MTVPALAPQPDRHGVLTLADLALHGLDRHDARKLVRAGGLVRLVPGAFTTADLWRTGTPEQRHALRSLGLLRVTDRPVALSHTSAAAFLGLPLYHARDRLHVCRLDDRAARTAGGHTVHRAYGPDAVTSVDGVPTVVPALAALGVAAVAGLVAGVVALDAALRTGATSVDQCVRWLDTMNRRSGIRKLCRVVEASDHRAESPLESVARLVVRSVGIRVTPQAELRTADGAFVARVDLLAEGLGVVIEIDGRSKYRRADATGSVEEVLREKRRENAIRDLGHAVVRLEADDLRHPERIRSRILTASRRASTAVQAG